MILSLTLADHPTGDKDVFLELAGERWVANSYYLGLASEEMAGAEAKGGVQIVLRRLLEQWRKRLLDLGPAEAAFLPYDFSDEYTAWLRCTRTPSGFTIVRGWSKKWDGGSLSPLDVGNLLSGVKDFAPDSRPVEMTTSDMMDAVDASLAKTSA